MQVITLNPTDFEEHARMLAKAVEEGPAIRYSAIVAVRRGGSFVCDAFCRYFPKTGYGTRFDVTLQRPSTKRKEGGAARLLKCLPRPILDAMRMAEATIFAIGRKLKGNNPTPDVIIPDGLKSILTSEKRPQILVIDDAIDSGDTLSAIVETLKKMNPNATVSTAVMTVTTRRPRIRADYTLYCNRTLIRFPWSNDYKEN
ncbi:MAG: hypothetical protein K2H22_05815 [Muribaculaceae bacterium]|nr:hypothetical protein [Muribaculaceae bacterium]